MKGKRLSLMMLLAIIVLISASCSPSVEEVQPSVDEYQTNLKAIYNELENQYAKNKTKEEWDVFSKEWMSKLTGSTPEPLTIEKDIPKELKGKVSQLNDAKSKLMYLWNKYNKKIEGQKFKEDIIIELKGNIEKNLK